MKAKSKRTRIAFGALIFSGAIALLYPMRQNRCVVTNNFGEPLAQIEVDFAGNFDDPSHRLLFHNLPTGGSQWQLYEPRWGNSDSSCRIVVQGVTVSGKKLGSDRFLYTPYLLDFGFPIGSRFQVTVLPDGKIKVPSYDDYSHQPNQ